MKSKKVQFGPSIMMGGTARLIMMGSIDACQPLRKRSRAGLGTGLVWLVLLAILGAAVWLFLNGFLRDIIPVSLY